VPRHRRFDRGVVIWRGKLDHGDVVGDGSGRYLRVGKLHERDVVRHGHLKCWDFYVDHAI
jgi:hypothetical protein